MLKVLLEAMDARRQGLLEAILKSTHQDGQFLFSLGSWGQLVGLTSRNVIQGYWRRTNVSL